MPNLQALINTEVCGIECQQVMVLGDGTETPVGWILYDNGYGWKFMDDDPCDAFRFSSPKYGNPEGAIAELEEHEGM